MDFTDFTAGPNDNDRRLDKVLRKQIKTTPLSTIYKYIRKGLIKVNHKKTAQEYHVQCNDIISIASFIIQDDSKNSPKKNAPSPKAIALPPIIFRNEHILIINKPYDITVHGNSDSLDKIVERDYENLQLGQKSLSFAPGPLHRLDRKTTGLLAFSQSLEGAKWFSENIKNHSIQKRYLAVLEGLIKDIEEWKDNIQKDENITKGFHTVKATHSNNYNAHTITKPLAYGKYNKKDFTLAEIEIKTGLTHQIRAQSSLHKHPLFGDTAYGGKKLDNEFPDFFLQAYSLKFPENPIGLPTEIKIEYSDSLKKFLSCCDLQNSSYNK